MFFTTIVLLTGCLYPEENLQKNQVPNEIQMQSVQMAVTEYQKANNGRLPIKNRDSDTPIFEKYPIDFKVLKQYGFLPSTPGNAFEEGGIYQYVLINVETEPTVKVIDLTISDEIRNLYMKIDFFRNEHIYPPYGQEVSPGLLYEIDYEKLHMENPIYIESPYSGQLLPVIMDTYGELYIDYRKDVYELLRNNEHDYKEGDDIRYLLTDHYPFAPTFSYPLTVENGEPVFLE